MLEAKVTLLTGNTSNREIMATKILDEGKKLGAGCLQFS